MQTAVGVIAFLQEGAKTLSLRAAVFGVFRVVDVDLYLAREKLRKAEIREVQNETSAPNEVHEVVNEAQVDGLN